MYKGCLTVWAFLSPISFSSKTELTALMDKLQIHVRVCVLAWKTNDENDTLLLIQRLVLITEDVVTLSVRQMALIVRQPRQVRTGMVHLDTVSLIKRYVKKEAINHNKGFLRQ